MTIGDTVQLAYVDQARELNDENTVYKEVSEGNDMIAVGKREMKTRAYLASFNFRGADQQKKVKDLSGGERNRLAPLEAAEERRQSAVARRADERSRRRHAARARGSADRFRGMRGGDLTRSLVPRSHRDAHAGVRGEFEMVWFEGNYKEYDADLQKRKGADADQPHRIKYKKLVRG